MLEVLNYLDPLSYYNLQDKRGPKFFPNYEQLSSEEKKCIEFDSKYINLSVLDANFQALKKGVIPDSPTEAIKSNLPPHPEDLYRFTAKFFHNGWLIFFWIIRLKNGNSFFRESFNLIKSLRLRKVDLYEKVLPYFITRTVFADKPKVSIILPTLNRYFYLHKFLKALSSQSFTPMEVIIVDQSDSSNQAFYEQFQDLPIQVIFQKEKGQWKARNEAICISKGDFLLFADDDSIVKPDWIEYHLRCLSNFNADISAGVTIEEGSMIGKDKTFFHLAEEFDSGNAMVRREVFEKIGLFDQTFDGYRMGDTEFGLRAYLAGLKSVSNPLAGRLHIKAKKGGMRFWGSKKAFKPISFWGPRPDLGVLYLFSQYFDKKHLNSFLLPRILISYTPFLLRKNILGWISSFIQLILFSPVWYFKLLKNKKKAYQMKPYIPILTKKTPL